MKNIIEKEVFWNKILTAALSKIGTSIWFSFGEAQIIIKFHNNTISISSIRIYIPDVLRLEAFFENADIFTAVVGDPVKVTLKKIASDDEVEETLTIMALELP